MSSRSLALRIAAFALALLAAYHLTKGFHTLVFGSSGALDLNWRFQEIHLFWNGPVAPSDRVPSLDVQRWDEGNYLPSSHILGTLIIPPLSWTYARTCFAFINVLSLVGIVWFAHQYSRRAGLPPWLLIPAILACSNLQTTLALGQYGIVVVALLSWTVFSIAKRQPAAAIATLTFAAVKPALCVPFFLMLLAYRRWRILLWSGGILGTILFLGFWSSDDPLLVHLKNYRDVSAFSMDRGYGPNTLLLRAGVPGQAVKFVGLFIAAAFFLTIARFRPRLPEASPLTLLALTGFAGRAWFPSYSHDNVMLIPLLVAVASIAFLNPHPGSIALGVITGFSLWLPGRWMNNDLWVQVLQWTTWLCGIALVCSQPVASSSQYHEVEASKAASRIS